MNQKNVNFLDKIGAPARRAFEAAGLTTLVKVSRQTEAQLLELHGVGPRAIKLLQPFLEAEGLKLAKEK
jgi:hypothetical protein